MVGKQSYILITIAIEFYQSEKSSLLSSFVSILQWILFTFDADEKFFTLNWTRMSIRTESKPIQRFDKFN